MLETVWKAIQEPTPTYIIVLAYLVPYAIAYLVFLPNTRIFRMGLYPIALMLMVWVIMGINGDPSEDFFIVVLLSTQFKVLTIMPVSGLRTTSVMVRAHLDV